MSEQLNGARGENVSPADVRFLVEKNADGIVVLDQSGTVLFANPAAETIFGRPVAALLGSCIGVPGLAGENAEISVLRPGGEKVDVEVRVVETGWDNRPALLVSLRDISLRRAMEERLRHSAKMEAVGRLTAGIAHDFNNLLTVVIGNLDMAKRAADEQQRLMHSIENAMRGAKRAAALTERLLSFARRKPLEPKFLDANALVGRMSDLLQRTLGEHISVRTSLASDLCAIEADPTELEAAILNLAVNARDAMPNGGTLTIETGNVELDSAYAAAHSEVEPGFYVLVAVTDTGAGMTPEVAAQAFEPFFTTKPDGLGTGLGLSHVYGFVRQSGGHAQIYSEPGIGTTVKLYFPCAKGASTAAVADAETESPKPPLPQRAAGETILVVEDDTDVREYTTTCLRDLGYRVLEAREGTAARAIIDAEAKIDLLVTDLGLPGGMDGKAVANRAQEKHPHIKVLFMTAYAAAALVHDGRLDAGVELLPKPFTSTALCARVHALMQKDSTKPRVLVVEDEALVRMLLTDTLADAGCEIDEAGDAETGLEKFRAATRAFRAAIVDVGLPGRRGDALAHDIRAIDPDIPIVLCSGYAQSPLRDEFGQDSKLTILSKPFTPVDLKAVLQQLGIGRTGDPD